jgi:hypothetical protein
VASRPARNSNSLSHATILVAGLPENDCFVAAKKPADSRQGAETQLETTALNEMLGPDPVAFEPLQHRHNGTEHVIQATPARRMANAPPDLQQTPTL